MKWHEGPLVGFDLETTAPDPHDARIVTAAIVYATPGARPQVLSWLINLGIEIPDEAAAVHGWTTQRLNDRVSVGQALRSVNRAVRELTANDAIAEVRQHLTGAMAQYVPVVIFNAPYDTTVLNGELERASLPPVGTWDGVVDPPVIEKQFDPYRKVKRDAGCQGGKYDCKQGRDRGCGAQDKTLTSLCQHYGVIHAGAHDSTGDALASVRLARRLATVWPEVGRWTLPTLHRHQVDWRSSQADGLRAYFDKIGQDHDGVCPEWPVHTSCARQAVAS